MFESTTPSPITRPRPGWAGAAWVLLNFAALGLGYLADVLSAQAMKDISRTFQVTRYAAWVWLAGLVMAVVWVGLGLAQRQAAARAPRWGFGLMFLITGALVVIGQPAVFFHIQDLLARVHLYRPLRLPLRLILQRGFADFSILTAEVLLALNLLGLWETRSTPRG